MSPLLTNRSMFEAGALVEGQDVLEFGTGTRTELGGILDILGQDPAIEIVPLLAAQASCGGPLESGLWHQLHDRMIEALRAQEPVDAVIISLHGSTLAEDDDDCCGTLLASIRAQVGPRVPIAATLDMHGNPTAQMTQAADALVAYKTYPHHDFVERGQQAARIAIGAATGEISPVVATVSAPMNLRSLPLMEELIEEGVSLESDGAALCCSIMPTHPYLDVPDFRVLSAVVVTNGDRDAAVAIGKRLITQAWNQRDRTTTESRPLTPLPDALALVRSMPPGTVVIADPNDAVTGGFPGDCPALIGTLLENRVTDPTCHILTDPTFVERALQAGIGGRVSGPLGGTWGGDRYRPIEVDATVVTLSDGSIQKSREPMPGHLEVSNRSMGPTAVVRIEPAVTVVVTSVPVMSTEGTVYRSVGIEPYDYRIVSTKSVNQQRFHYTGAAGFIDLDGPGWGSTAGDYAWRKRDPAQSYPLNQFEGADIEDLMTIAYAPPSL
ncbi:MAG: M81 family metallopeptidase [Thermomicrobiales bacterium]|nr:M81 family metallopeptidase [Thermomicrobiales bacterium]MCO5220650.1 M81 family metallopeptidase [Thermomicrobiales bacterium]